MSKEQASLPGMEKPTFITFDVETAPQSWTLKPDVPLDVHRIWRDLERLQLEIAAEGWLCAQLETGLDKERIPKELLEIIAETDDLSDAFPYYVDWIRETAGAPLQATGVAPALHPTTATIVSAGFGWLTGESRMVEASTLNDHDLPGITADNDFQVRKAEKELIDWITSRLAKAQRSKMTIVTFNGVDFDCPMVQVRAMLLGAKQRVTWGGRKGLLYPFESDRHADLRIILGGEDRRARGTLAHTAKCFGTAAHEEGALIWSYVQAKEWEKIHGYSIAEQHTLIDLWLKVRGHR